MEEVKLGRWDRRAFSGSPVGPGAREWRLFCISFFLAACILDEKTPQVSNQWKSLSLWEARTWARGESEKLFLIFILSDQHSNRPCAWDALEETCIVDPRCQSRAGTAFQQLQLAFWHALCIVVLIFPPCICAPIIPCYLWTKFYPLWSGISWTLEKAAIMVSIFSLYKSMSKNFQH
jgi:hypothetical protein